MSTTIGFGLKNVSLDNILMDKLSLISEKYDYEILYGEDKAEKEVIQGIAVLAQSFEIKTIGIIKSPSTNQHNYSSGIELDLTESYFTQRLNKFSLFLTDVLEVLNPYDEQLIIFFAYDWHELDRVRLEKGTIDVLQTILDSPSNWQLSLYDLKHNVFYSENLYPLIFIIKTST
jgi:hypothetical protein